MSSTPATVTALIALACLAMRSPAQAVEPPSAPPLPAPVMAALAKAHLPANAMSLWVAPVSSDGTAPRWAWRASEAINPASLTKLLTSSAALDVLGPTFRWQTPIWMLGDWDAHTGVLKGSLLLQGQGDPSLTLERIWLGLRRLRQMGLREVQGDVVLDHSLFQLPEHDPARFDGEPWRPYNVAPDALLLNLHAQTYRFMPDPARGVARVSVEPPLDGVTVPPSVPLRPGACLDWRTALKADYSHAQQPQWLGHYIASCGEQTWPVAFADPAQFGNRLIQTLWRELGGTITGTVRQGPAPRCQSATDADGRTNTTCRWPDQQPAPLPNLTWTSPPLVELLRDINKFSNNAMAEQVFLTLGRVADASATPDAAKQALYRWLQDQVKLTPEGVRAVVIDNGSGLSREGRVSAEVLAQVLQYAWRQAWMPELLASLPVAGLDGTLKRVPQLKGRAHLKTGSLRDVNGWAGYVLGNSGERYVLVAALHHPDLDHEAVRTVLEATASWVMNDAPLSPAAR